MHNDLLSESNYMVHMVRSNCATEGAETNPERRIEKTMANRTILKLNVGRRLLLAGASMLAVAGPIATGLVNASRIRAQSQPTEAVAFEAASVKPHAPGDNRFRLPEFLPGGRFASSAPLRIVIATAYNLPFNFSVRLSGGPDWLTKPDSVFDIEATAGTGAIPAGLSFRARTDRMRLMLQTLLADRFKLVIHRETKELPVYALVVGKGGPKLQKADIEEKDCPDAAPAPTPGTPTTCHIFFGGQGRGLHARAVDMSDLASFVENWAGRPLLDKTGIKGLFHIETSGWLPMQPGPPPAPGTKSESGMDMADLPTLFGVFERLGLKMESQRDRVNVYVIDSVERPTEN